MSTYVIGDIQGCRRALENLLDRIAFRPGSDRLVLCGDLVARGHDSLGTLRLLYQHRDHVDSVLGNHDLHLLALAAGKAPAKKKDADLQAILDAGDGPVLLDWLRHMPLALALPDFACLVSHAGLPPGWSPEQALARSAEVEAALQGPDSAGFFANMYGNEPTGWDDNLRGYARLRVITNYLTRMRFVDADGHMELHTKGEAGGAPAGYMPWFDHPDCQPAVRVLFGHWAALDGHTGHPAAIALDTGCVWGGKLTALRLEDDRRFSCRCG